MTETSESQDNIEIAHDEEFDSRNSRCLGLLKKSALKKSNNSSVYANQVTKSDGPFYCPACLSEAIVRKCTEKVDHFAHSARQSPVIKRNNKLHNKCRDEILQHLQMAFPDGKWAAERAIPSNTEKDYKQVIPDLSGRINNLPVAIEIQLSPYTVKRIADKAIQYQKRNPKVSVLYVIPLSEELGDVPFRPRLYEKFLHSMFYGRVYYWTPNSGSNLIPVHFSPAKRYIEPSSWFDIENKEERVEGGFWLTYRTVKEPSPGPMVDICTDFVSVLRKEFEPKNLKKSIPECTLFKDKLKCWWNKKEYKEVESQFAVFKDQFMPSFISDYTYIDEYDEDNCDEE
ncbi:MAG TPA: competence protein CoiA family protein [Bacteroidia bacterium]|nr:competence protein CoiA family protein [Bacteroidia bacterium]HRH08152.1 competence protein CoiA family protein [Bacteroidia bacterium]